MEKAVILIVAVVVILFYSYVGYTVYHDQLRKKELDKKLSDNLDDLREINKIIKEKLDQDKLVLMIENEKKEFHTFVSTPQKNGKVKDKKARKEISS